MKYNPDIHHRRSIRLKGYNYSSAGVYFITICTQNKECLFGDIVGAAPRGRPPDSGDDRPDSVIGRPVRTDLGRHRDLPLQHNEPDGGCPDSVQMILNDAGKMIFNIWNEIPKYYPGIDIDEFQIMPNHIHGIIIVGAGPRACPDPNRDRPENNNGKNMGNHGELPLQYNNPDGDCIENNNGETKWEGQGLSLSNVMERFKSLTTKKYIDGVKLNNWKPFDKRLWQRNYYEQVVHNDNELNRIREYINNNPVNWKTDDEFKE